MVVSVSSGDMDIRMGNVAVCVEKGTGEKYYLPWEPLRKSASMPAH